MILSQNKAKQNSKLKAFLSGLQKVSQNHTKRHQLLNLVCLTIIDYVVTYILPPTTYHFTHPRERAGQGAAPFVEVPGK